MSLEKDPSDTYAGKHLLVDLYQCSDVPDPEQLLEHLKQMCTDLGATVLFGHAHRFSNGGSSGVIVLAESHCTWHYWLEEKYIALDVFVCGSCEPRHGLDYLQKLLTPKKIHSQFHLRGPLYKQDHRYS